MKLYRVELADDNMQVFTANDDTEAFEYCDNTFDSYLEIYELDDDYNEIRTI